MTASIQEQQQLDSDLWLYLQVLSIDGLHPSCPIRTRLRMDDKAFSTPDMKYCTLASVNGQLPYWYTCF